MCRTLYHRDGSASLGLAGEGAQQPHTAPANRTGRLDVEEDDRVALAEGVSVVTLVRCDVAAACGAVEGTAGLKRRVSRANLLQA